MRFVSTTLLSFTVLPLATIGVTGCGAGGAGAAPGTIPAPPTETKIVDLEAYVEDSLRYVWKSSEGYYIPTESELLKFDAVISGLVNQNLEAARVDANEINFQLLRIIDTGAMDNELYCLEELVPRGQGFYCIDMDAESSHHYSVPHPLYDVGTNVESVAVMRGTGGKFLSMSSSHRCANAAESACSGETPACGDSAPFRVSDAAHNVDSFFYRFGKRVHDSSQTTITMQLHGCGSVTCPAYKDREDVVARVSAGSISDLPSTELVNVLNARMNELLADLQLGSSRSCNEPSVDKLQCGTVNPLGRYINGQVDSCQNDGVVFTDSRWLHIEQSKNLRRDEGEGDAITPDLLIRAINDSFE